MRRVRNKQVLNRDDESWRKEWQQMPLFDVKERGAIKKLVVSFETEEDMELFSDMIGRKITMKTRGIFFPVRDKKRYEYVDES